MKQSAKELVRLCVRKDPSAWEEFVRRFGSLVFWAIERSFTKCRFSFSQEDLEDTFQQVFSHLWERGLKRVRGIEKLDGWLAVVSFRIAVDYVRRETRRAPQNTVSLEGRLGNEQQGETILDELLPSRERTPRENAEEKFFEESLDQIFKTLTEKEACILRLNLLEEKTHSEISELLKIPIGTVSSLIQRTKKKVRSALKGRLEKD